MVLARWQAQIVDDEGNTLPGASIEVRREVTGSPLAVLYSDRAGTVPLGNPFAADSDGYAFFHAAGGAHKITVTASGLTRIWRYVGVGLSAEHDFVDVFNPRGLWNPATTYNTNDLVSFEGLVFVSNVDSNVGHSPPGTGSPITAGSSDSFWTYLAIQGANGNDGEAGSSDVTGTSTTSIAIGAATPTFTVVEENRGWAVGARLRVSRTAAPTTDFMEGVVTAYSGFSLTLAIDMTVGSGTFSAWTINLAGQEGEAATIAIGTVNTIPPGSPSAAVRNVGTPGQAVLDFDIPQGVQGDQGIQGVQGIQGETGTAATIQIGIVNTIPFGSPSAAVRNTGTPQAAILDFDIPTGPQGDAGAAATIQIGVVTSIPPGSPSAAVRNVGTPNAAILDFDLEQGAQGPAGADGTDPGYLYNFETATASPPSSGAVRFNNANLAAATQAFISDTTRGASNITARLLELFDASKSTLTTLVIMDPVTEAQATFLVTSASDSGAFIILGVASHAGATSFAAGAVSLQPIIAGSDGADGTGTVNGPDPGSPAITVGDISIFSDATGTRIDSSGKSFATVADVQAATPNKVIDAEHLRTASVFEPLADTAPTLAIDWTAAINWEVTIDGNRMIGNPTLGIPGTFRQILFKGTSASSPTEPHAVTFDSQFGGDLPTISDVDVGRWYLVTLICLTPSIFSASAKRVFGAA
jgi:hypothetical protein